MKLSMMDLVQCRWCSVKWLSWSLWKVVLCSGLSVHLCGQQVGLSPGLYAEQPWWVGVSVAEPMPHLHHSHHGCFSTSAGGKGQTMPAEWAFLPTDVGALLCWAIPRKYAHLERSPHTSVSLLPAIPSYYFKVPVHPAKLSASMIKHSIYTTGPLWERGGRIDWEKPLIVGQSEKLPHLATMTVKYEFVERLWATTFAQPQSGSLLRHFDSISDHHKLLKIKKKKEG